MGAKKTYIEVTVKQKPVSLIERISFSPWPTTATDQDRYFAFPSAIRIEAGDPCKPDDDAAVETLRAFIRTLHGVKLTRDPDAWPVRLIATRGRDGRDAYRMSVAENGATIRASDPAGLYYGVQTLIQLLGCAFHVRLTGGRHAIAEPDAFEKRWVPAMEIADHPAYALRSFMIDMGRANFSMPLIKRIVRIMSHLKLNLLHLHLLDDQLCGLRFKTLPLGSENPAAITLAQLGELVAYARRYHVSVMPEIESWGHVKSVIYHYPELYGGPGMWGGMSFGMGEQTYALLGKMYDEVVGVLEPDGLLHAGLDEAVWALLPDERNRRHTPVQMVRRIYDLAQDAGKKHGKRVSLHLWADHGGRPLPRELRRQVVIEPWKYRQTDEPHIVAALKQYGGRGKTPCMMGAGWSSAHYAGSYEATRIWAREGVRYPNILGVTNCMWENNDLAGQMIGLYGGAAYSWNPLRPVPSERDPLAENLRCATLRRMRDWQAYFHDADPDAINRDRGPAIAHGRYAFGPWAGEPVAPTVEWTLVNKP